MHRAHPPAEAQVLRHRTVWLAPGGVYLTSKVQRYQVTLKVGFTLE